MVTPHPDAALALDWTADPAAIRALSREWLALAEAVGADVYQRPDWLDVWWDHFGRSRQFACLTARAGGELVGVLPFVVERIWVGPIRLRIARLAGIDPNCIVFQLALREAWAAPVLRAAMVHLVNELGCRAVSFTPVSDLSRHLAPLQALAGPDLGLVDAPAGTHITFDFPSGFDAYLAGLTKKRRGQYRRDIRGLTEIFGMERDNFVPDAAGFDDFVAFHNQQWQAVGKGGHFTDWPGSAAFYRDLSIRTAEAGLVQLDRLNGHDGALATEFSLVCGHTAHWRLPARRLDPDVERLSAGKVVFVLMFERMIRDGITRVEGGRGEYSYKLDYGGVTVPVHRLIVGGTSMPARWGLRLLLAWADLVNLLYYRIWFLKLAPRLRRMFGTRPRPLWRLWIRTRL